MNTFFEYLRIELKKSIKVFQKSLVSILLVLMTLTIGVAVFSYTLLQSQVFQLARVAVVIPESEDESKLVLQFLSGMDSVKSICEFDYMDEAEAFSRLKTGEVQAIISLPENFYEDVYYGENTPATIYVPKEKNISQKLFQELLTSGMLLLQVSEAGVYSSQYLAYEQQLEMDRGELGEYIALEYAKEILGRNGLYEAQVLSPLGGVDFVQYYFSAVMLLVMFLSGILFGFLYRKENRAVEQKLSLYGLDVWKVSLIKISVMSLYLWLIELLFLVVGKLLSGKEVFESLLISGSDWAKAIIFGIVLALTVAGWFHMVYSIGRDYQQGTIFLLVSGIFLFLCSGLFVPVAYLPRMIQKISVVSPLTIISKFQLSILFGQISLPVLTATIILAAACTAIGVFFSWKNA